VAVTLDILNAIPGRPEFMGPWQFNDEVSTHRRFVCKWEETVYWDPTIADLYLSVCYPEPHLDLSAAHFGVERALELTTYGCAVLQALKDLNTKFFKL
jgi:hypothetical protein